MISSESFISALLEREYSFFTGVPCSFLKHLINDVIAHPDVGYVPACSEGEAVGIAAGAHVGGAKCVLMCQNSGLGNMVNPLTSLNFPFKIPALLLVSLRGEPGIGDEPQHELMGVITERLLETMDIPWEYFPVEEDKIAGALERAEEHFRSASLPYALVVKKGSVKGAASSAPGRHAGFVPGETGGAFDPRAAKPTRMEAIGAVRGLLDSRDAVIATTGKTGRELYTIGDASNQLYMVGSMGCAMPFGLGLRLVRPEQRVVVLDGDGAVLMKMGAMATVGLCGVDRFVHVVFDNESYDSTGGQDTASPVADFCSVAAACGYVLALRASTLDDVARFGPRVLGAKGPVLLHIKVARGSAENLGRPEVKPPEVKKRFMEFIDSNAVDVS